MIESKRLEYKAWTYDDMEALEAILGNPNVCEYLPGNKQKSKEELTKWLHHFIRTFDDETGQQVFAIYLKGTDKIIGYGGLAWVSEFNHMEIMYGFNEEYWGKGYAKEASIRFKEYAIERGLNFIIALADINNIPSQKILEKTGYKQIKTIDIWGITCHYYEMEL